MVVGLGTTLPLRPAKRAGQASAGPPAAARPTARVHSNSHLGELLRAMTVTVPVAGSSGADPVDTPSGEVGEHSLHSLQPTASGQSNVRGTAPHDAHQAAAAAAQQQAAQQQQESGEAAVQQPEQQQQSGEAAVQQPEQQQGTQRQQNTTAGPDEPEAAATAAAAAGGGRKRKPEGAEDCSRQQRSRLASGGDGIAAADTAAAPLEHARSGSPAGGGRGRGGRGHGRGRGGRGGRGSAASRSKALYADVLQKIVAVPGAIFAVKGKSRYFYGRITKAEPHRAVPAVEVLFLDDKSKYWFPTADVRGWMGDMVRSGAWAKYNPGAPPPAATDAEAAAALEREGGGGVSPSDADADAAEALPSLSASLDSGVGEAAGRDAATVSSGKPGGLGSRPGKRSADEGKGGAAAKRGRALEQTGSGPRRKGALMKAVAEARPPA